MKDNQYDNVTYIKDNTSNYVSYRKEALYWIQQLSGNIWSDYNAHDPGITILEVLCYSLTELEYKLGFSITDILASNPNKPLDLDDNTLYTADKIFTTAPVTANDYRKILIDQIEDLNDVWIISTKERNEFDVHLVLNSRAKQTKEDIISNTRKILDENQSLGIHFREILIAKKKECTITLDIVIEKMGVPEKIIAEILFNLDSNLCNPTPNKYNLSELKSKGLNYHEIYDGPFLDNGIISELCTPKYNQNINIYKFKKLIADIKGVAIVEKFTIHYDNNSYTKSVPVEQFTLDINYLDSDINVYIGDEKVNYSLQSVTYHLSQHDIRRGMYNELPRIEKGRFRNIDNYISIKQDFPKIYFSNKNKSTKQFEGFLTPYENFFKQRLKEIGNFSDFFNINSKEQQPTTNNLSYLKTRNLVLDHLLLRFSITFSYSVLYYYSFDTEKEKWIHHQIKCKEKFLRNIRDITSKRHQFSLADISALEQELYLRLWILNPPKKPYYKSIDNYFEACNLHENNNLETILRTGMKYDEYEIKESLLNNNKFKVILNKQFDLGFYNSKKIIKIIRKHIKHYKKVNIQGEGFYIIPNYYVDNDDDSYLKLSVFFSGWSKRFQSDIFRKQVEVIVSELVPAHIQFKCFWLNYEKMKKFETAYFFWSEYHKVNEDSILTKNARSILKKVIKSL